MPDAYHLLLIDDDSVDRAQVRRALAPIHTVTEATTAAAGLEAGPADVVLLDVRLPDADGLEVVPTFVERGVPVVMLSGVEDTSVVVEAMQLGALDYLVKSQLEPAALERSLRRAAETSALRQAVAEQQQQIGEQRVALEARHSEVRALASALTLAEQAERRRISVLLHDHVQQLIYGAQMMVESLRAAPGDLSRVERASDALGRCATATRELAVDLTPPVLDNEDLSVAMTWVASHFGERHEIEIDVVAEDAAVPVREIRVLLVELVRELLFNVVKHAEVRRATIRVSRRGSELTVAVEDDGRGFDPAALRPGAGFGLFSVRGRLELLGGRLDIESVPNEGSRVRLVIEVEAPV